MKLLLSDGMFDTLASQLSKASKRFPIEARIESYSCKMVSEEKRQYRAFMEELDMTIDSPTSKRKFKPDEHNAYLPLHSSQTFEKMTQMKGKVCTKNPIYESCCSSNENDCPVEDLCTSIAPRDLFSLIGTLNSSFAPEYDFSKAKSTEFCHEPRIEYVERFISHFCSIYIDKYRLISNELWREINNEIDPKKCSIYSYLPDHSSDPYSRGCLTSFNYFFHNKMMKRVLFFSVRVLNDCSPSDPDEDDDIENDFIY